MSLAFIGMGSNVGNSLHYLTSALDDLQQRVGYLLAASSIYRTEPWQVEGQAYYLNQVCLLETSWSPLALMYQLLEIERIMGRVRTQRWGPRRIDLDLLLYDHEIVHEADLQVPHPRMTQRNFVLVPICEIASHYTHPVLQVSMQQLLHQCGDHSQVKRFAPDGYSSPNRPISRFLL